MDAGEAADSGSKAAFAGCSGGSSGNPKLCQLFRCAERVFGGEFLFCFLQAEPEPCGRAGFLPFPGFSDLLRGGKRDAGQLCCHAGLSCCRGHCRGHRGVGGGGRGSSDSGFSARPRLSRLSAGTASQGLGVSGSKMGLFPRGWGGSAWQCWRWEKTAGWGSTALFSPRVLERREGRRRESTGRVCTTPRGKAQPFLGAQTLPDVALPQVVPNAPRARGRLGGFTSTPFEFRFVASQNRSRSGGGGCSPGGGSGGFQTLARERWRWRMEDGGASPASRAPAEPSAPGQCGEASCQIQIRVWSFETKPW